MEPEGQQGRYHLLIMTWNESARCMGSGRTDRKWPKGRTGPLAVRGLHMQIYSDSRGWRHCQGECVNNQKEQSPGKMRVAPLNTQ